MGKADICESDYLENPEVFADLVNGVLYQGKQVVKPQELREQDGELRSILGSNVKKMIRDKVRLWKGTAIAVLTVENQTRVDYHMVFRAMLSESMAYDRQWEKRQKELEMGEEGLTSDEFISGMRKGDKYIPVITIVVYYGRGKPWDGARTLYELLDIKGNEESILPFISDYQMNIFDYHEYDDFGQFHSELEAVFEFLRYSEDKEALKVKMTEHKGKYEELSNQAKVLLMQLSGIDALPDIGEEEFKKGEFSMCKAFADMKEEGKIEGRAEEIVESGYEFNLSETDILERLQKKLDISEEEAQKFLAVYGKSKSDGQSEINTGDGRYIL